MNIFVDAVSSSGVLILFDDERNILFRQDIDVIANESSMLVSILDNFLSHNQIKYSDLNNIVVVNGPGSFTGIRSIVLIANTINFVINKNITPINYFDLFNDFPIIKASSKRDLFVKTHRESNIKLFNNQDFFDFLFKEKISTIYGDINKDLLEKNKFINNLVSINIIDYNNIIKNIEFKNFKIIEPFYFKKPAIS